MSLRRNFQLALPLAVFLVPASALFAQTIKIPPTVLKLIGLFSTTILNPIIAILFSVALVYFIYGVVQYIWNPDNEQLRERGRRNMLWGIIGLTIMVSVFGIMRFIISTLGAGGEVMNYI